MSDTRYGYVDSITKRSLLNRAIAFVGNYTDFTEDIFPEIEVPSSKFQWMEFGKESFEIKDTERALYSDAEEINLSASFKEGSTQSHSIALPIDIREIQNAYDGYDVFSTKQEVALNTIMRGKMKEISRVATDTTNSFLNKNSINIDGTTRKKWNSPNSDPFGDIMDLKSTVESTCGVEPNRLIIGRSYWRTLVGHESFKNMLSKGSYGRLTRPLASTIFDVEKVIVPTPNYYDATKSKFLSMLDNILICAYVDSKGMSPAWGNTFIRKEPQTYQEEKNRYVTRVGADIEYKVIIRSKGSAGYINNAINS